jgi:hypothetical protein
VGGGPTFVATEDVSEPSLLEVLRKVDRSFQKSIQTFRATNRDGSLADLIKSLQSPPWKAEPEMIGLPAMLILAADPAHSVIFTKPS